MTITIITVNFNRADTTIGLLKSLESQTDHSFDVIVVDNASAPHDRERLGAYAAATPLPVDIIYANENTGFSGGNNVGIRKALAQGSTWVLLLNNDTIVVPTFIRDLILALPETPGLVGLPIHEGDRTVTAGIIRWLRPTLEHTESAVPGQVRYAIGAALAIHREVVDRIGLLDESYFLYFEDAEYSLRARSAGIPILFPMAPVVRHAVSASTASLGAPLLLRYHVRNMIRMHRQHAPWWAKLALPFWALYQLIRQSVKLLVGLDRAHSTAILAGIADGIIGSGGSISTRPVIAVECESLEDESWGVARQVRGMLEHLIRMPEVVRNFDIILYFKGQVPAGPWNDAPNVRCIVVRPFRWLPPSFSLYFYVFFPIRVWFDRPSVTLISNYMLPLIFIGRSIVMLTEDVWHEMHGDSLPLRYRIAYRIFATWAARRATRIMAISHASKQRVASLFGIAPERIAVNELAVPRASDVEPHPGRYLLYVAQGLPRRHLRETIQAFATVAKRRNDLRFYAIGPDKYRPPIIADLVRQTNEALGRDAVIWTERVSDRDLARAYAGAQALVYVSDMEAFGLPPIEALAYGVPSILLDAPVHRELLGVYAFYVPTASADDIAAAIERSGTDEAHRTAIRQAAPAVIARYTWEAHARRMLDIIRSIL